MSEPVAAPSIQMHPVPTGEEAAAIAAALTLLWANGGEPAAPPPEASWRFSGRWWTRPVPLARTRPYRA